MSRQKLLCFVVLVLTVLPSCAFAQSPVFITQTPTIGNSGHTFFIFLPVANIGTGAATNMQLTSVALTFLGSTAGVTTTPADFPFLTGSGHLAPTGLRKLDLEFDNSNLINGNNYLLTVRGTYEANGKTLGFALNRFVVYESGLTATHPQVLDLIAIKFDSLPGIDRLADNQELLAFVKGLPQISAAGLCDPPTAVWATFADNGEKIGILNNLAMPSPPITNSAPHPFFVPVPPTSSSFGASFHPSASTAQLTDPPTELPSSIKARLLNGLGSGFANAVPDIHSWLVDKQGYSDAIGADMTVEALRNVGGDGVMYINSHAGLDKKANLPFNIWTTTPITKDPKDLDLSNPIEAALKDDIDNGRVVDVTACDHYSFLLNNCVAESHYGITAAFVVEHWHNFADNALVFINACDSDLNDPSAQDFKTAIFTRRASVYAGWTNEVNNPHAADTTRLVFDRLLGANEFCPEDGQPCHSGAAQPPVFAQRSFDYTEVIVDLPQHHLGNDGKAQLIFTKNPYIDSNFGLLAPSISNMSVDEFKGKGGQLTINGIFGQDPRPNGSVQIGGMDATIESWSANSIVVDLNSSGSLSAGDVQVKVRLHKSNVARLTEWRGNQFNFTIAGNGSLQLALNYNLHFRADIRKFREHIHVAPREPIGGSLAATDSTGTYSATGSGPGIGETFNWSGSGALVYVSKNMPITGITFFEATAQIVDSTHLKSTVGAASEANAGATCTIIIPKIPPEKSLLDVAGPSNLGGLVPIVPWYFNFELDSDNADILQKESSTSGAPPLNSYFCMDDRQTAKYDFKWGPVPATPGTAPDPKSAR